MERRTLVSTILKGVALVLSVAVVMLTIVGVGTAETHVNLLAFGLFALALVSLQTG